MGHIVISPVLLITDSMCQPPFIFLEPAAYHLQLAGVEGRVLFEVPATCSLDDATLRAEGIAVVPRLPVVAAVAYGLRPTCGRTGYTMHTVAAYTLIHL